MTREQKVLRPSLSLRCILQYMFEENRDRMSSLIYPKHSMCRKETWKISEQRGRTAESAFFIAGTNFK